MRVEKNKCPMVKTWQFKRLGQVLGENLANRHQVYLAFLLSIIDTHLSHHHSISHHLSSRCSKVFHIALLFTLPPCLATSPSSTLHFAVSHLAPVLQLSFISTTCIISDVLYHCTIPHVSYQIYPTILIYHMYLIRCFSSLYFTICILLGK